MNKTGNTKYANWIIIVLIVLNIIAIVFIINAYNQPKKSNQTFQRENRERRMFDFMQTELQLTEDQSQQFEKFGKMHFEESKAIFNEIQNLKNELYNEVFNDSKNQERVNILIDSIGLKHSQLERLQIDHFDNIRNICTPEQQQKFQGIFNNLVPYMCPTGHHGHENHRGDGRHNKRSHK